jgi:ubiquinol-cytochrome c reductase cytochrome c1 subunit
MLGTVDQVSAQRGLQVYQNVCASCHSLKRIAFRNLGAIGFSEAEIKTLAESYEVADGPNQEGEMFVRPGRPSDRFPSPFANEEAARASNGGAYPPDLSLMVKARPDGANYLYSLLVGYQDAPEGVEMADGQYYNPYFPGGKLAMPAPLSEGLVEYQDGTVATVEQMAHDLVNFLQWTAEPEMQSRKRMGLKVLGFLVLSSLFFYAAKRIVWRDVK